MLKCLKQDTITLIQVYQAGANGNVISLDPVIAHSLQIQRPQQL